MSYSEIEKLLGRPLPPTAYGASWRQWWANTETHSQAQAWLRAGWRVTRPDLASKHVEFRRAETTRSGLSEAQAPASSDGETIVVPRRHLNSIALRMLEDAAEQGDGDLGYAIAELLNTAAMARRRQLLDWFAEHAPRAGGSSVQLIREDRDAG